MADRKIDPNLLYVAPELNTLATIRVIGVGGGGCNAVDRMIESGVQGIEFIAVNTDYQVIERSKATTRIQIGEKVTRGLGAGADPSKGEMAANESKDDIGKLIQGTDMLFITAGMGGGTGTGAAPIIASIAREMGILTVAVVTRPFDFEGAARKSNAEKGIEELQKYVDSLIIVPNDKLLNVADDDMGLEDAFALADQVLKYGVAGISDLVAIPGTINLDLADVRRVMSNAGICHMGIGRASGPDRAAVAINEAIHSPLLETSIEGARRVIVNYTGSDMRLKEVSASTSLVRDAVAPDADIIFGAVSDPQMGDDLMITIIASGFDSRREEQRRKFTETRETKEYGSSPSPFTDIFPKTARGQQPRPFASGIWDNSDTSKYKPLTPESTSTRNPQSTSNFNTFNAPKKTAPQRQPQEAEQKWDKEEAKPASKGILPWFFSENEDHIDD